MFRKKKYLLNVFLFILLGLVSLIFALFLNTGLDLKTSITNNELLVTLTNNSSHIINNIEVYNDNEKIFFVSRLNPEQTFVGKLKLNKEVNHLKVKAEKHLSVEKIVRVKLPEENQTKVLFTFSVKHNTFIKNQTNSVELKICNNDEATTLEVDFKSDDFFTEKSHYQVFVKEHSCETLNFQVKPLVAKETYLVFVIHNDFYYKEIKKEVEIIE